MSTIITLIIQPIWHLWVSNKGVRELIIFWCFDALVLEIWTLRAMIHRDDDMMPPILAQDRNIQFWTYPTQTP